MMFTENIAGTPGDPLPPGIEERMADLTRPLGRLGNHMQRKNQRILRSGERGIRSAGMAGLGAAQTYRVTPPRDLDVGANKAYAASTNWGPKGGFYLPVTCDHLAIPILDGLTASGRAKFSSPSPSKGGPPEGLDIVGFSKRGNILLGKRMGKTPKGRARTRSRFKGTAVDKGSFLSRNKVYFVLVERSPLDGAAKAYQWCTFDPDDEAQWNAFAADWIWKGR